MLDTPLRGFSFSRGGADRLAPGESADADNERSPPALSAAAAPPERRLRRSDPATRLSVGLLLYLISIGLVATTTILVFFGVAFMLLLQPSGGIFRSAELPNPVTRFGSALHGLWTPSDGFRPPTADTTEPIVFRQPTAGSNVETASSIIPAVTRPAAAEALPSRTNGPAGTDNVAQSSASTLISETVAAEPVVAEPVPPTEVLQAEATRSGRELLAVASTRAPSNAAGSPEAAPVSLTAPVHPGLSAADIADLLDHGDALLRIGDIASARLFYERAADAGNERAALHLGASFDPDFLSRAGLSTMQADAAQADLWYRRAVDLGAAAKAKRRLDGGGSK